MPFNVGPLELIIVLVIALLVVGPGRLPEMGNAMGKTIREFRKASTDITEATSIEPETKPAAQQATASPASLRPRRAATPEAADPRRLRPDTPRRGHAEHPGRRAGLAADAAPRPRTNAKSDDA